MWREVITKYLKFLISGLITSDDGDGFYTSAVSKAIDVINQKGPAFGNSRVDLIKHTDISPDAYILSSTGRRAYQ